MLCFLEHDFGRLQKIPNGLGYVGCLCLGSQELIQMLVKSENRLPSLLEGLRSKIIQDLPCNQMIIKTVCMPYTCTCSYVLESIRSTLFQFQTDFIFQTYFGSRCRPTSCLLSCVRLWPGIQLVSGLVHSFD